MADNSTYREWLNKYGMEDVNEILSKNEYHSPEESDPDNDPNASMEHKRLFVYKLSWRAEKASWQF
ncbi:MAG TPA: hypothetical protein VM660_05210 [Bacillus sp. (in: firmicutes)]|jgi:hypothetical protein|nr:hypothetical protein [Bacillus sp. (in: firmicutes)]